MVPGGTELLQRPFPWTASERVLQTYPSGSFRDETLTVNAQNFVKAVAVHRRLPRDPLALRVLPAVGAGMGGRTPRSLFLEGCSRNLRTQGSPLTYW